MTGGENMKKEIGRLKLIAFDLRRTLNKLDFALELYCDYSSPEDLEMFIDCKLEQQMALDYVNDILTILKPL